MNGLERDEKGLEKHFESVSEAPACSRIMPPRVVRKIHCCSGWGRYSTFFGWGPAHARKAGKGLEMPILNIITSFTDVPGHPGDIAAAYHQGTGCVMGLRVFCIFFRISLKFFPNVR